MAWVLGAIAGIAGFWLALQIYGGVLPVLVPGYLLLRRDAEPLLRGLELAAAVLIGTVLADFVYRTMAEAG